MSKEFAVCASGDWRYDKTRHFIKTDVDKSFLKRHGIKMTIFEFKKFLGSVRPDFTARAGNLKLGKTAKVEVYCIHAITQKLSGFVQCAFEGIV